MRRALVLVAAVVAAVVAGCSPGPSTFEVNAVVMGTDARLVAVAQEADTAQAAFEQATDRMSLVEELMSTYLPTSEVSRLNAVGADTPVLVSPMTLEVFRAAVEMSKMTGGAFDVTYAPLRTVWRTAATAGQLPTDAIVAAALARVGTDKLTITQDGHVSLAAAGMEVDLGGIAKGYAIDMAVKALQENGIRSGIVDIGHDLRLFGERPGGGKWRVGVYRPPGVTDDIVLEVGPCAVTTSGDYARGFDVAGEWYSHIIDPRTGWPVKDVTSVTVIGPDAITADAMATALSVAGAKEGIALVESLPDFECLFMTRAADDEVRVDMSSGFRDYIAED